MEIQETKDYKKFKLLIINREVNQTRANKIKFSMEKHGFDPAKAISVTKDFEIIDGQHRFHAAKELGISILYVIDKNFTPEKLKDFNTTSTNWSSEDYLKFWEGCGRTAYTKLRQFQEKINFPLAMLNFWMRNKEYHSNSFTKDFQEGKFQFVLDEQTLAMMLAVSRLLNILREQDKAPKRLLWHKPFHEALKLLFTSPLFDVEKFFNQLPKCMHYIKLMPTTKEYLENLLSIYNYEMRSGNRLFLKDDGRNMEITN